MCTGFYLQHHKRVLTEFVGESCSPYLLYIRIVIIFFSLGSVLVIILCAI